MNGISPSDLSHSTHSPAVALGPGRSMALDRRRRTMTLLFTLVSVIFLVALLPLSRASAAETSGVNTDGPWIYTRQIDPASESVQDMATTAAIEDNNVWLLLTCNEDRTVTLSFMHVEEFPYPLGNTVSLLLRIDEHPTVSIHPRPVTNRQMSIDRTLSHGLLPLLLDGERSSITIADSRGDTHDYSFVLRPNERALSGIRAKCL